MARLVSNRVLSVVVLVVLLGSTLLGLLLAPAPRVAAAAAPAVGPDFTVRSPAGGGAAVQPTPVLSPTLGPTPGPLLPPEEQPGPAGEQSLQSTASMDRGYYGGLIVEYYDVAVYPSQGNCDIINSSSLVATEVWGESIGFGLTCTGQSGSTPPWKDCRLHHNLTDGTYYGVIWEGLLLVPEDGEYTFYFTGLDDRARLTVGTTEVIKHWCYNDEEYSGDISLDAGLVEIKIEYFQGVPSAAGLQVKWEGPSFSTELIPVVWPFPGDQCSCGSSNCELAGCSTLYCPGQPINAFDGDHTYHVQDLSMPVVGRELSFARTYASQDITATALGYGWTHGYAMRLVFSDDPGGEDWTTVLHAPDGAQLRFYEHYSGTAISYAPYPGVHGDLVRLGSTPNYTYVVTGTAQTTWTFDQDGVLQELRDPQGHATTLSYTTTVTCTNVLDRVTGPDADGDPDTGRYLAFTYDDDCRLVEVRDHGDRFVAFAYDLAGDLVVVTDTRGFTWTYTYSGSHLLYEVIDPNGHLVEKTAYDEQGRAVQQWVGALTTPALELEFGDGLTRVVTDARGISQTVVYDARNTWAGTLDAAGYPITRSYDANFNLNYVTDANGNPTAIEWNACGCRPTQITDALDGETTMTYDERNNLTSYTDAGDHTTAYYYAEDTSLLVSTTNELSLTTYYTYSDGLSGVPDGLLIEMAAPGNQRARYQYDSFGQMRSTAVYSAGEWITTTTSAYDDWGRTISTTTFGRLDATYYDAAGHVTRTVQNCTAGDYEDCRTVLYNAAYPDRNIVTANSYDPAGRLVLVTNTLDVVSFYEYNDANQLIRTVENYDPAKEQNEDNLYNITTRYGYDAAGHQTRVTNTLDVVTWTGYDTLNRVAAVTVNYTATTPNPDPNTYNLVTAYGYDPTGNQVTVTNPGDMVTVNGYDELNRLVTTTVNYTTTTPNPDPSTYNLVTTFGYDSAGNQVTVTNPLEQRTVTTYDELNRVQKVTQNYVNGGYNAAAPDEDVYTLYHYDSADRQDAAGRIGLYTATYGFDALGRQTTVTDPMTHTITSTYDVQGRLVATTDANGHTTTYGFDALGRTVAVTDALTQTTYYVFDGLGRRTSITDAAGIATHYQYDRLGRLLAVTENYSLTGPVDEQTNVRTDYGYDPLGNRLAVVNARGYTTTYEYDALSRLIAETDPEDHTWEYGYDSLGRQVVVTDPLTVTTRTYDDLGRLRQVEYGDSVSATYSYNALGSRTAMTDATGVTAYLSDDLGRVLLVTHTVDATVVYTVGYGYDGRGLRTLLVYPDGTRVTSTYDLAGRLVAVDGVTTTYAAYDYDPGSRLISATLGNGVRTAYAYDAGDRLLAISHTLDGDLLARFLYEYNAVGQRTRAVETVVAPDLELGVFGEEVPPPTATVPAGPFHIYLPVVPRTPAAVVAAQPGPAGVGAPLPFDPAVGPGGGAPPGRPGGPIVRTQKAFRAAFDEQGLRYTPTVRLVETGAYHMDWRLTQVRSGQTKLFQPGARPNPPSSPPGQPDRVRYDRGTYFQEEYLVAAGGVEQRFVFLQPFPIDGDLEIEGNLLGNLDLVHQDSGEIAFLTPAGDVVSSYGRALVEDGCGERLVAQLELDGRHLRIVVPRDWLERACFPVVVDPLIGPNFAVSTQPIAGNQERASVAYGGDGRTLVAWHGAGNATDTYAQVLAAEGMLVSGTVPLDTRTGDQKYPDVAGNPGAGSYLAVWQGATGMPAEWNIYARLVYSDGTYGARRDVYTATYDQQYPAVAFNANDEEYLVVWRSYNTFSGLYGIYGQVVEVDGDRSGSTITIHTANVQLSYPDVTFNVSDTQYLVAWQEYSGGGMLPAWEIRGEIVAADGSAVVAAFDILTGTADQTLPAAAYSLSDTAYLVVGQHYAGANDLNDVRARWVGRGGELDTAAFAVATGSDDQRAPDAACAGDGVCLVAWERQAAIGVSGWDIYARRIDGGGTAGSAFSVYDGNADQRYPAVAYNTLTAEYIVGWQDYRSGSQWDVYVQRVDADGTLDDEEILVSAEPAGDAQDQPAAAYGTAAETHLVVWTDDRDGNDDIYGQFVASGGALVETAFAIAQASGYFEQTPVVAYDPQDDVYLVVWARRLPPLQNDDWNIYAQRVAGDGDLVGNALTLCAVKGDQTAPTVAYNAATGYFLIAWEDTRDGGSDVYARAVPGDSGDPGDEFLVYAGEEDQYAPTVAANAAAQEYLVVWQNAGKSGADVYGQRALTETTTGDAFAITQADGDQQVPALTWSADRGAYLVVWQHDNGSDWDIHGRVVAADGDLRYDELTIAARSADEQYPAVAANGAGGYVVAWQSGATNSDIAAAVVDRDGQVLGSGVETLSEAANTQAAPALSYDSARGRYLAVWADYRNTAEGPDIYGQLYRDYTVVLEYSYDPLYRLVRADYSTGVRFGYAYDETGNRTILTETTPLSGTIVTTYDYDDADRLLTVTRAGAATAYTWNDRGDLLADGTQEYAWDAAGRLASVSVSGGPEVAYLYDGGNDRTAMIVAGVTTTYVVDPFGLVNHVSQVLAEETDGAATRDFYGLDLLAQAGSTTTTYLGYDALSVRLHLGEDGGLTAAYRYGPFGEVMGAEPAGYGFSGERWDEPVGLLYLRARYYAPEVGRFVSQDPLRGSSSQPATLQRFLYAANNPVSLVDPTGLRGVIPWRILFRNLFACPVFSIANPRRLDIYPIIASNFESNPSDVQRYEALDGDYRPGNFGAPDFNRYDKYVSGWADFWNWYYADILLRSPRITPNLVKAMLYKESVCGTLPGGEKNVMQIAEGGRGYLAEVGVDFLSKDEVQDPNISIAAGTRLLLYLYEKKWNWPYAIQAYRSLDDEPLYNDKVLALWWGENYEGVAGVNPYGPFWTTAGDAWTYLWFRPPRHRYE